MCPCRRHLSAFARCTCDCANHSSPWLSERPLDRDPLPVTALWFDVGCV